MNWKKTNLHSCTDPSLTFTNSSGPCNICLNTASYKLHTSAVSLSFTLNQCRHTCPQKDDLIVQRQLGEMRDPLGPLDQGEELFVSRLTDVCHWIVGLQGDVQTPFKNSENDRKCQKGKTPSIFVSSRRVCGGQEPGVTLNHLSACSCPREHRVPLLWIISSKEERAGRQSKQCFCLGSRRKYLQRAAAEQTTFPKQMCFRDLLVHIESNPCGQLVDLAGACLPLHRNLTT